MTILRRRHKSDLSGDAKTELDKMATILKAHGDYTGSLRAFTDSKGTPAYNDALSGRRAEAAKAYLVGKGIAASRLSVEKRGESEPIAKNTEGDEGRRFNRRVELYVNDGKGTRAVTSVPPTIAPALKN